MYADTSTSIALNFLRRGASVCPSGPVVNNHFDSDGALAVWALLHPEEALLHERLLVDAASAGDFSEWPQDSLGAELNAALLELADACGDDAAKAYDAVLPEISGLLRKCAHRSSARRRPTPLLRTASPDPRPPRRRRAALSRGGTCGAGGWASSTADSSA